MDKAVNKTVAQDLSEKARRKNRLIKPEDKKNKNNARWQKGLKKKKGRYQIIPLSPSSSFYLDTFDDTERSCYAKVHSMG